MARTALTPVTVTANTSIADVAGTSYDATNSHVFTPTSPLHEYIIRATNTTSSTKTVTVKAGDNPPADAAGQGDLVVSLTAGNVTTQVKWIGPLTSSRFLQDDGTVNIDVAGSMTGAITIFRIPRNA
jgi:hypothetical protein